MPSLKTAGEREERANGEAAGEQGRTEPGGYLGGARYTAAWMRGNTMGLLRRWVANPDDEATRQALRRRGRLIEGPCNRAWLATHNLA